MRFGSAVNHIAAIAALDAADSAIPDIMTIGPPANPRGAAFLGQTVLKHGRTTGLTFGSVVDFGFDGRPPRCGRRLLRGPDRSPAMPDRSRNRRLGIPHPRRFGWLPVGLLFAGDDPQTIANRIQAVLNRFGATVPVIMTDIRQANRYLGRELRTVDDFVGVGVGSDAIRLYASAESAPVVNMLLDKWGSCYKGFAVSVVLSDGFEAQSQAS